MGAAAVIVVAIDTSTPQTSVAIGTEREIVARMQVAGKARQESVTPALEHLLRVSGLRLEQVAGFAVGIGPGLFTGLRVGVATAKTLAQVTKAPIVGLASLDVLAYRVRHTHRSIVAVIDGRRGEVFSAFYEPVPGGVLRRTPFVVQRPEHLVAELDARPGDVLAVGDGAILYADVLAGVGARLELASAVDAHPDAAAMVELAAPRFMREEHDSLVDLVPVYLRKSDAEIALDHGGS